MKRFLLVIVAAAVIGVIAWLGVTRHLAVQRATRLDAALMNAEARLMQVETDLEAAKQRIAELGKGQPSATTPSTNAAPTTAQPTAAGERVRFAATAAGVTNLVRIEGTSSMHNWQVEGRLMGGSAEFGPGFPIEPGFEPKPGPVEASASVFVPVRSLKSVQPDGDAYSSAMDEIMYQKLLAETHARITYRLQSLAFKEAAGPNAFVYEATGTLAVAGVTNEVKMPVTVSPQGGGKIQFSASLPAKMTDFKITPPAPSAAGVVITTGDDVKLILRWWVSKVAPRQ